MAQTAQIGLFVTTLRLFFGIVVTVIWAAVWIVAILRNDYGGATALTPLILLVAGGIFSDPAIRMLRNGKEKRSNGD